ncbi:MAG: sugar ABC transporter permease, partial [SAR324 cluster bacterium]|nr:sugar ABC transporter permease [SAR324 cluster bacterium]
MERDKRLWRIVLLTPPLLVFSVLIVWPLLSSFYYSFTNWNGFSSSYQFVGLSNFQKIWTDRLFFQAT